MHDIPLFNNLENRMTQEQNVLDMRYMSHSSLQILFET
jgi:hypothetical protein